MRAQPRNAFACVSFRNSILAIARSNAPLLILLLAAAMPARAQQWNLTWSDEFNGPAGSYPDPTVWTYDTGGGGFGNAELEFYCAAGSNVSPCDSSTPNVFMDGVGSLVIRSILTPSGKWTSTRMKTQGLKNFQYGRIEARMKLTPGDGLWPAFWMLGSDITTVPWPGCGEQDIMEWVPQYTPTTTSSTDHGPGYSGGNGIGSKFTFPNSGQINDPGYHTYGVVWSPYKLQYYRDDSTQPFFTDTPTYLPPTDQWVYNDPFFILLNQAIGGNFPKPGPDATTPNPSDVLVDYVRYYNWSSGQPDPPTDLDADADASNQVYLSWRDHDRGHHDGDASEDNEGRHDSDNPEAYDIYASTTAGFTPSPGNLVVANFPGTRYTVQALNPGTTYYFLVLTNTLGGESVPSNQASATTRPFGHGRGIKINAGGQAVGDYASSMFYAGGATNRHPTTVVDTSAVQDPAPQAVYQTEQYGASDWAIPNLNPNEPYLLRLHFAENGFTIAGARQFNVVINSQQVLTNFDIFATASAANKAVVEDFLVTPDEKGIVSIQFEIGAANVPTICGIELVPEDSDDWYHSGGSGDEHDWQYNDLDDTTPPTPVQGSTGGTTTYIAIDSNSTAAVPAVAPFVSDIYFADGLGGSTIPVPPGVDVSFVTNPAPQNVYRTQRIGNNVSAQTTGSFGYFIPGLIPGATYNLRLHFAEGFFNAAGLREFNVVLDAQQVLTNFDIWATANAEASPPSGGKNRAVIEQFPVQADRYGMVMVGFLSGAVNLPSLRGLELIETAPPPPPPPPDNDGRHDHGY